MFDLPALLGRNASVQGIRRELAATRFTLVILLPMALTFRAHFRAKMSMALGSWEEQKNDRNPRTSRRHPGPPRPPQAHACGRMIGPTLPDPWPWAGLAPRLDARGVVRLPALRGRPPARARRAMGHRPSAPPQALSRQPGQTACPRRGSVGDAPGCPRRRCTLGRV